MGLSGSSQTNKYTPSPQATQAASAVSGVYNANAGNVQNTANQLLGALPGVLSAIPQTTAGVTSAANYNNAVLGGQYLSPSSNPALAAMMSMNDNAITDQVNSEFGAAGRTGSGEQTYALSRGIGDANNSLLFQNYQAERQAQTQAAANAGTLNSQTLGSALNLGTTAAGLPLQAVDQYASGIGSLNLGGTTTTQTSPSLGAILGQIASNIKIGIGQGAGGG